MAFVVKVGKALTGFGPAEMREAGLAKLVEKTRVRWNTCYGSQWESSIVQGFTPLWGVGAVVG